MAVNTLPAFFRKGGEQGNATYDFYDIASGTGYITFLLAICKSSNSLSTQTVHSYPTLTTGTSNTADYVKVIDLDFDVLINRPLNFKGNALIDLPWASRTSAGGENTISYIVARIRKWDGTTETEIANNTSSTIETQAIVYRSETLDITVPLTNFKVGEYLRLTIEGWTKYVVFGGGASTGLVTVYHDPFNAAVGTALHTDLKFQCPVRIDL